MECCARRRTRQRHEGRARTGNREQQSTGFTGRPATRARGPNTAAPIKASAGEESPRPHVAEAKRPPSCSTVGALTMRDEIRRFARPPKRRRLRPRSLAIAHARPRNWSLFGERIQSSSNGFSRATARCTSASANRMTRSARGRFNRSPRRNVQLRRRTRVCARGRTGVTLRPFRFLGAPPMR